MAGGGGFDKCPYYYILKPYLVKWSTKGECGQKCSKNCPHGLWMTPYFISIFAKFKALQNFHLVLLLWIHIKEDTVSICSMYFDALCNIQYVMYA